ncbi:MAG TPA: hypothetical protein VK787_11035 [Puia sp.]|jgi:hypothetical protein|nr:hypothetical protein [Puia sp.]
MPVITCLIEEMEYQLEYQKDSSDNTYSGLLHLESPVLFSFSDSLFIPHIAEDHQQAIKNAIKVHEALIARNSGK